MDSRERRDSAKLPCEEPSALDAHARFWCARLTGRGEEVEVLCGKGRNQSMPLPEPCGRSREGTGEASAGAHVGRAIERRKSDGSECRGFQNGRRQHRPPRDGEGRTGSAASKNPRTHVRPMSGPGRSLRYRGALRRGRQSQGESRAEDAVRQANWQLVRGWCSETSCCSSGCKSRRRNSQFAAVVISGRHRGRPGDLKARK